MELGVHESHTSAYGHGEETSSPLILHVDR